MCGVYALESSSFCYVPDTYFIHNLISHLVVSTCRRCHISYKLILFLLLELLMAVMRSKIEIHLTAGMSEEEFLSELLNHRITKRFHRAVVCNLLQAYETGKLNFIVIQG